MIPVESIGGQLQAVSNLHYMTFEMVHPSLAPTRLPAS